MSKNTRKDGVIFLPVNDSALPRIIGKHHVWKIETRFSSDSVRNILYFNYMNLGELLFAFLRNGNAECFERNRSGKGFVPFGGRNSVPSTEKMPRAGIVPPESKIGGRNGKKVRLPKGGSPLFQVFFPVAMILGYSGLFLFYVGFQYIKLLTSRNKNGTAPLGFLRPEVSAFALLSAMESIPRAFPSFFLRRDRKTVVRRPVCVGWNISLGRNTFGTVSETLLWPMSLRCRGRKMKKPLQNLPRSEGAGESRSDRIGRGLFDSDEVQAVADGKDDVLYPLVLHDHVVERLDALRLTVARGGLLGDFAVPQDVVGQQVAAAFD